MAQLQQVLRGGPGAALVVDLDARLVRERARVDHHQRHAGGADLLDLGVRGGEARPRRRRRPSPGPSPAASEPVERGDEVERVALLLGGQRDALAEGAEERVGEDHRQRLRRQHADGVRLALGEHPRDRVRAVAERVRDVADPARRLGRQPVRAVEGERHGGLRHARLAGDVGDARPARGPLLHGLLVGGWPGHRRGRGGSRRDGHGGRPGGGQNRFSKPV